MSERWACHTKPRMKPEEVKHDIAYRKQFAPKPAEPVTDAGKARPVTARQVLLAYGNGWHGTDCNGNFRMDAACSCGLEEWLTKAEAQAQDLILSDVDGLARAMQENGYAYTDWQYVAEASRPMGTVAEGTGPTPAAALRALREKLEQQKTGGENE